MICQKKPNYLPHKKKELSLLWFVRGRHFLDAALALHNCKHCPPNSQHSLYGYDFLLAIILNTALGLELMLQAIIILEDSTITKKELINFKHNLQKMYDGFEKFNLSINTEVIKKAVELINKEFGDLITMRYWFWFPPEGGGLIIRPNQLLKLLDPLWQSAINLERYCIMKSHSLLQRE